MGHRSVSLQDPQNLSKIAKLQSLEAVVQKCSVKKMFSEIRKKSQENTCVRESLFW